MIKSYSSHQLNFFYLQITYYKNPYLKEKKISFVDLKNKLGITSGNFGSHLKMLEKDYLNTFKKGI